MDVRTITEPGVEPIPLAEAKIHLRVDQSDEDDEIGRKIRSSRVYCEKISGLAFITRTLAGTLDEFPTGNGGLLLLPHSPATELVSVKYYDVDGNEQTLDAADYEFDPHSKPARLRPTVGSSWPATETRFAAVEIQWKAGYGDTPTDVPEDIRSAMKLALGDLYEQRESIVLGLNVNWTKQIDQLLANDRLTEGNYQ
jgi:uncharacterized phiE125 gp8 family phage protein